MTVAQLDAAPLEDVTLGLVGLRTRIPGGNPPAPATAQYSVFGRGVSPRMFHV
jgi:hypothetical protein